MTVDTSERVGMFAGMRGGHLFDVFLVTAQAKCRALLLEQSGMETIVSIVTRQTLLIGKWLVLMGRLQRRFQLLFMTHQTGGGIIGAICRRVQQRFLVRGVRIVTVPADTLFYREMDRAGRKLLFKVLMTTVA